MYSSLAGCFLRQTLQRLSIPATLAFHQQESERQAVAHAKYARSEATYGIPRPAVACNLLINIANDPGINLLGQLMRHGPIQVEIYTTLVVCRGICKIIS